MSPKKVTIGPSASITIKVYNKSKYNSGYETITYYLPFAENGIRFGQVVT